MNYTTLYYIINYRGSIKSKTKAMKYMEVNNVLPPELLGRLKPLPCFTKQMTKSSSNYRRAILTTLKPHTTHFSFAPWLTASMIQVLYVSLYALSTTTTTTTTASTTITTLSL